MGGGRGRSWLGSRRGGGVRTGTERAKAGGDVGRQPLVDAVEIRGLAEPPRQGIDSPGLGEGERQRPGQKLIAPVDLARRTPRQRLAQYGDEFLDQGIQML